MFGLKKAQKVLLSTGPKKISIASNRQDVVDLAIKAWENIKSKKVKIENLIFVSQNFRYKFPANSAVFLAKVKIKNIKKVFDLNSACTGFLDAMEIANGLKGNTLIINSETYSKNINKFDRSVSTIFADGASAFIFEKKKYLMKFYSDVHPELYQHLMCEHKKNMKMNGAEVYQFVKNNVYPSLEKIYTKNKSTVKTIFLHQGSKFVCNFFKRKFQKYKVQIPENISKRGNTVSATIPILIHDHLKNKKINGDILMCGFGVGLNYKIVLLKKK